MADSLSGSCSRFDRSLNISQLPFNSNRHHAATIELRRGNNNRSSFGCGIGSFNCSDKPFCFNESERTGCHYLFTLPILYAT
jgi:hypothetical protein